MSDSALLSPMDSRLSSSPRSRHRREHLGSRLVKCELHEAFPKEMACRSCRLAKMDQRRFVRRTTSLVTLPRARSRRLPPFDQLKPKIRPEVNFVSCRGSPPDKGCSQRLPTPSRVRTYCRAVSSGDQRKS